MSYPQRQDSGNLEILNGNPSFLLQILILHVKKTIVLSTVRNIFIAKGANTDNEKERESKNA